MKRIYLVELYLSRDMSDRQSEEREYLFSESKPKFAYGKYEDAVGDIRSVSIATNNAIIDGPTCRDGRVYHFVYKNDACKDDGIRYSKKLREYVSEFFECVNYERDEIGYNIHIIILFK